MPHSSDDDEAREKDEFSHFGSTNNDLQFSDDDDEEAGAASKTSIGDAPEPAKPGKEDEAAEKALEDGADPKTKKCDVMARRAILPMTCVPEKCRRNFTGALLLILSFLLFADQQLVAPSLHDVGESFNLTDDPDAEPWQSIDLVLGGYLPLCFFALGTPISLFIGPIIDKSHRRNLFVLLIFLAEIPCFLTFFATEVWQLLFFRSLTGISMAGAEPLIYSIMSDMYGPKERTVMASVISIGAGAGLLAGQSLAGYMGPSIGWRYPFLAVSIPSMAFATIVLFVVEEPARGAKEEAVNNVKDAGGHATYDGSISCAKVTSIVKVGTNLCMYFGELPNAMGWGVLFAYLTDFIAVDKNFGTQSATTAVSIFGVGLGCGAVAGGLFGQFLTNRCAQFSGAVPLLVAGFVTVGALPFYWAIDSTYNCTVDFVACNASISIQPGETIDEYSDDCIEEGFNVCTLATWATMICVMFFSGLMLGMQNANVRAMLLNVNLPEVRGTSMTLLVVVSNLGKGVGPLLAATMIAELGRNLAFNIAVGFFIISAVPYYACVCLLGKDIRRQAMAVEAIVKVQDTGSPKRIQKKVTMTNGEIIVETLGEGKDDELPEKEGKRGGKRSATVPVGSEARKRGNRKYKVANDSSDVVVSADSSVSI